MSSRLKEIIECLIFVSMEALSLDKLKAVLDDFTPEEVESAVNELLNDYSSNQKGFQIIQAAGGYLFTTKEQFDPWVRRMLADERKNRISPASLETLSVIAYHQPVTQAEISAIRGVDSSHSIKTLLHKKMIKITGRKKSPGKPLIYRTTDTFLSHFGLNDLKDLPSNDEISKILDDEAGEEG